jgi:hypothetical protein
MDFQEHPESIEKFTGNTFSGWTLNVSVIGNFHIADDLQPTDIRNTLNYARTPHQ